MPRITYTSSNRSVLGSLSLLVFASLAAQAQAQTTNPDARQPPAAISTSPQAAAEANDRAVPRADTGTVVRTGPTAGERVNEGVGSAADATRNGMRNGAGATRDAVSSPPDASRDYDGQNGTMDRSRNTPRPRADRG